MFVKFCWGVTGLAVCLAALLLREGVSAASSAPQEAAAAAMAAAIAIIPYVFTRAVEGLVKPTPASPSRDRG